MSIEETKLITTVKTDKTDDNTVNEYLKLGWTLINQYVSNIDGDGDPVQSFVLAWQQIKYLPPKFPPQKEIYKELE